MSKIHVINLGMVNVYIIEGQGYVLVDTGLKKHGPIIVEKLKAHGIEPTDINLIILTHGHEDHIGGLEYIRACTKAKVILHTDEYKILMEEIPEEIVLFTLFVKTMFKFNELFRSQQEPFRQPIDFLVEDEYDLKDFGIDGKVIHTPGHSKGSLSVIVGKNAIIGDNLMAMMPWSKPQKPMLAYDLELVKRSINKIIDLGVTRFYLSHGKEYDVQVIKESLKRF